MQLFSLQTKTSIKNIVGIAILAGSVTGCSKNEEVETWTEQSPIQLQSTVSETRSRIQNEQIEAGENLSFFVAQASDAGMVYDNVKITANGAGEFSYSEAMYYPVDNSAVNFYAIHPYNSTASLTSNNGITNFSVIEDQTSASNYLLSDLLHASKDGVSRTKDKVELTFSHKLSKFTFTIIAGNGMELSTLNTVSIVGVKPATTIDIVTGNIEAASGNDTEIMAYNVRGTSQGETQVDGIQAIIVPQAINAGSKLFKVTIGTTNYYYTPNESVTFKEGYNYNYELTINQTGINVTSTITPWINSETIKGDGEAE